MDSELLHYPAGGEVHLRDRVRYHDNFATVVCVTDGDNAEFSPGYEDYSGFDRGIMICDDDGTVTSIKESDDQLVFVGRV
jgi:hypothetical protein